MGDAADVWHVPVGVHWFRLSGLHPGVRSAGHVHRLCVHLRCQLLPAVRRLSAILARLIPGHEPSSFQTDTVDITDHQQLLSNRALLTMTLASGADVSVPAFEPHDDILNIHCDIIKYLSINFNLVYCV